MAKVGAVVLETDGSFNVLGRLDAPAQPTLRDVQGSDDYR
jgi:hypothetical protein